MVLWFAAVLVGLALYVVWERRRRQPFLEDISGKAVLVTGCDSGFGRALAIKLTNLGCRVFAGCLTSAGEKSLKEAVSSDELITVSLNVTDPDSVKAAVQTVINNLPPQGLWGVVNNAGVSGGGGHIEFFGKETYLQTLEVNLGGMVEVNRQFLPLLRRSRGRIVNMASMAGRVAFPMMGPYAASKFAVEGYSDSLRRDLLPWGVSVHILEPGLFRTALIDKDSFLASIDRTWQDLDQGVRDAYGQPYIEQVKNRLLTMNERSSPDLHMVVDAYTHALFALHPKQRYLVGRDAKFMGFLGMLPAPLADWLFSKRTNFKPATAPSDIS